MPGARRGTCRGLVVCCEAPTLQVPSDRPDRPVDAEPLAHQLADRFSRPEGERQAKLFRMPVLDQTNDGGRLMALEPAGPLRTSLAGPQRRRSAGLVRSKPIVDRSAADAKDTCGLDLRHPLHRHGMNHTAAKVFLGFWRQPTSIELGGSHDARSYQNHNHPEFPG